MAFQVARVLKVCLLQVYSNPLFLSEGALPPTQLNKLSDRATVAETSTAIASLQIHQDATCASAAGSASGLESEQLPTMGRLLKQLHSCALAWP